MFKSWEEEGRKYRLKRHINGARRFILCFMVELRAKSQERGSEGVKDSKNFRSINLVGGLYKWLAKGLTNRL